MVLEKRILKGFYHIWTWQPFWSMDHAYFSNLSFSWPKEALHEIWATLTQMVQRSHLKVWTFFSYICEGKQTWPCCKKVKCQCMTIIIAILVDLPSPMIYAKIQHPRTSHPRFWKRRFLKVFTIYGHGGHLGQWPTTIWEATNEIWATLAQRLQRRTHFNFLNIFPVQMHRETNLFVCVEVLQPSQHKRVMSSVVSLPNHMFTGQA